MLRNVTFPVVFESFIVLWYLINCDENGDNFSEMSNCLVQQTLEKCTFLMSSLLTLPTQGLMLLPRWGGLG